MRNGDPERPTYPSHMYAQFFGLKQEPFSIAPDPRYLFMSRRHREALAHLLYGLNGGGGFVLLSGEIGAGKTTVCRCFLEQIPKRTNVAYILNPKLTVLELLQSVCDEFGIAVEPGAHGPATVKNYLDPLNDFLLRTHAIGQNNVLIIDEAQMLSADVLEQLRLLTNLETNERKLLQIVLIGQPELRTMLARPELEQLSQRVIARFHLKALSNAETAQYIRHRLAVGGMTRGMPFDRPAIERIHALSRGIPRRINLLCDRAMLGAYSRGTHRIGRQMVDKAAVEVFGRSEPTIAGRAEPRRMAVLGGGLVLLAVATAWAGYMLAIGRGPAPPNAAASAAAPASAPRMANAAAPKAPASGATAATPPAATASGTAGRGTDAAASSASPTIAAAAAATPQAPKFLAASDLKGEFKTVVRDEKEAWRELAPLWNLEPGDVEPCEAAQRQQVRCFKSGSSLEFVRRLGRPGIVNLRDDSNRTAYALLLGLNDQSATLKMGGAVQTISLVSFAKLWQGEFATYWRAPPGYTGSVAEGDSGPTVEFLATRLAGLAGEPAPTAPPKMNATLRTKVARFQSAHGIRATGTAGPTTFMQLNRAIGIDEPWLRLQAP